MKLIIYTLAFLFCFQLKAQEAFIIKDVKLFDGEKIIEKASVKVIGNKIVEVSQAIDENEDFNIIDGSGKTLMPALSNAHVHAWMPKFLVDAAKAGVLNVMDMHGMETYQQFMLNVKDSTNYARYYRAGYAATAPEGHGTQFGYSVPTLENPEDATAFIADRKKANVDYIKIIIEPFMATLSHETVAEIIREAHNVNLKAVVHVSNLEDAIKVLSNQADGLVHIWWDQPIPLEKLLQLKESNEFFIIPTLLTTLKAFQAMGESDAEIMSREQLLNEIKKLHDAEIKILAGTDPPNLGINYGTDLYEELLLLKEAGLSNIEVLKAGTINITEAFNLKDRGQIKEGYLADMRLINGDLIKNIEEIKNIEMVWKAGKLVKR
jgi:imidazolonepropionase-like amidohydrolase